MRDGPVDDERASVGKRPATRDAAADGPWTDRVCALQSIGGPIVRPPRTAWSSTSQERIRIERQRLEDGGDLRRRWTILVDRARLAPGAFQRAKERRLTERSGVERVRGAFQTPPSFGSAVSWNGCGAKPPGGSSPTTSRKPPPFVAVHDSMGCHPWDPMR